MSASQNIDAAATQPPVSVTPGQLRRSMVGLMLVLTLASLDGNIVGPALPRIVSDLGGLAHLSWVVTAFTVASTASTPLYGKLSDQFGRRRAFFVSIGLFLIGSALCGAAHSMAMLIGARAFQGVGAGGLITLTQTSVADMVAPRERGRWQGLVAGVFALCSVAGPLLGGVITDQASWPWIFYLNLPVGAAAIAILALSLPTSRPRRGTRVDLPGFSLLIGATCAGLLLLSWAGTVYPWLSWQILCLGAGTLVLLGLLALVERRAAEPALPYHLFKDRVFACGVVGISLMAASLFGSLVFLPLFFQLVKGASATEAGLRMAPLMAGLIVSSVLGGRLVSRTGRLKPFPVAGLAIGAPAYAGLALATFQPTPVDTLDALLVVLGLALGLVMPNLTTAVQNSVDQADVGSATSTMGFFRSLGAAFGVAVAGTILAATLHARLPGAATASHLGLADLRALPAAQRAVLTDAYGHALGWTFTGAALVAGVALVVVLFMPERALRGKG